MLGPGAASRPLAATTTGPLWSPTAPTAHGNTASRIHGRCKRRSWRALCERLAGAQCALPRKKGPVQYKLWACLRCKDLQPNMVIDRHSRPVYAILPSRRGNRGSPARVMFGHSSVTFSCSQLCGRCSSVASTISERERDYTYPALRLIQVLPGHPLADSKDETVSSRRLAGVVWNFST